MESLVNDIIPVFVEVTASESRSFQKEHQYPFVEFEALASYPRLSGILLK